MRAERVLGIQRGSGFQAANYSFGSSDDWVQSISPETIDEDSSVYIGFKVEEDFESVRGRSPTTRPWACRSVV